MEENKILKEIRGLPRKDLISVLFAYDEYVYQIYRECEGEPVGICEFYEHDYKEYMKGD